MKFKSPFIPRRSARRSVHASARAKSSSTVRTIRRRRKSATACEVLFMIRRFAIAIAVLVCATVVLAAAAPVQRGQRGAGPKPGPPHDPHDLNGVWLLTGGGDNGRPESEWSREKLPFTPAGRAVFEGRKPGKGPRADLPAKGN